MALVSGIFRDDERPVLVSLDGTQAAYYESEYLRRRKNDAKRHRPRQKYNPVVTPAASDRPLSPEERLTLRRHCALRVRAIGLSLVS
jgi:hypothetical protein